MDQLINAWRRGDSKFLEQHMLADIQQHAELYEAIVARRNRSWVKQIVALLQDESDYLVIVGALHLIGEDGIPRLLDRQGIDTRQLHDTL
jgi:uncharacterized protein YbaP (TraB family)